MKQPNNMNTCNENVNESHSTQTSIVFVDTLTNGRVDGRTATNI